MSYEFRFSQHSVLPEKLIVEVWRDGTFVAGIYPHEDGIRIISKYMTEVTVADDRGSLIVPIFDRKGSVPAAIIKLDKK